MYEHENKDLRLQQDCNALIYGLKTQIDRLEAICVMDDTDKACREYMLTISTVIMTCAMALHGDIRIPDTEKF